MKKLKRVHEKHSNGYERWTEYDEFGHETSVNASTGYWRRTKYDERGYTIHCCDSFGLDESRNYDNQGNTLLVKRGKLITEQHFYDEQGNMLRSEYYNECSGKLESWYVYEYDNRGNAIYSIDSSGYETHSKYDENNHPIHFSDNAGEEIWWNYDERGFLCHEIHCDSKESLYEHDNNGRETYSKLDGGKETWTEYDDERNLVIKKSQLGTHSSIEIYENEKKFIPNMKMIHYFKKICMTTTRMEKQFISNIIKNCFSVTKMENGCIPTQFLNLRHGGNITTMERQFTTRILQVRNIQIFMMGTNIKLYLKIRRVTDNLKNMMMTGI